MQLITKEDRNAYVGCDSPCLIDQHSCEIASAVQPEAKLSRISKTILTLEYVTLARAEFKLTISDTH